MNMHIYNIINMYIHVVGFIKEKSINNSFKKLGEFLIPEKSKNEKKREQLHNRILEAFNSVPTYEGFTTKDLAIKLDMPEPTARLHLELLSASKSIECYTLGKTKLYKIPK